MVAKLQEKIDQAKSLNEIYPWALPAIMFLGGFLFDVFTLTRIDELSGIIQQLVYLLVCYWLLGSLFTHPEYNNSERPRLTQVLSFRMEALHFAFGALLSSYAIFYFKSSSFAVSSLFLLIMVILLVANELPHFQNLGLGVKSALLALCTFSFFAYVIPILGGYIGALIFCVSLLVGSLMLALKFYILKKWQLEEDVQKKQMLLPWSLVLIFFLSFYFLKIMPPVPLSLKHIGVYHSVERTQEGDYSLGYYKPWWKFWSHGSEDFRAAPGDKVFVFFRLFAPGNFAEEIRLQWSHQLPSGVWEKYDSIPIKISGGRGDGFRGFGAKGNYTAGKWRTRVVTSDDREIGRITFYIEDVEAHSLEEKHIVH